MARFRPIAFLFCCILLLCSRGAQARVDLSPYGVRIDSLAAKEAGRAAFDSIMRVHPQLSNKHVLNYVTPRHVFENNTVDFYLLLGLCFLLGAIKTIHPKYFNDLWRAFINPTLGNRQLKDMIQSATIPNMLMNLFYTMVMGTYAYYLVSINRDWRFSELPSTLVIVLLIVCVMLVYICKYAFSNFTGWAFKIDQVTDQYNFNVFLVNKMIGIALLPFVVCFAFLNQAWDVPLSIASLVLLSILLLNRYARSWNIFGQFFLNSRFHFFMYLCAFEVLPMAILMKLVLRML
jgi:hypothetical protein